MSLGKQQTINTETESQIINKPVNKENESKIVEKDSDKETANNSKHTEEKTQKNPYFDLALGLQNLMR